MGEGLEGRCLPQIFPADEGCEWGKPIVMPEEARLLALAEWAVAVGRQVAQGCRQFCAEGVDGKAG